MKKKDYLYKININVDEKTFNRFQKFYINKLNKGLIGNIILVLLALIVMILEFVRGNIHLVILTAIFIVIYHLALNYTINKQIKKMYKSNYKVNEKTEVLYLYKDHIVTDNSLFKKDIKYEDIYLTCITRKDIYIFTEKNIAIIIPKKELKEIDKIEKVLIDNTKNKRYKI